MILFLTCHNLDTRQVGAMGESRVAYLGASGNEAPGWKAILGRMLRGQVNFDV